MTRTVRIFLVAEALAFLLTALVHAGAFVGGYEDVGAMIAESVIGAVLLGGFALTWLRPARTRAIALAVQGFALLGTLIGTYLTTIVGLGALPEQLFHVAILLTLVWGLVIAARSGSTAGYEPTAS